MFKKNMKNVQKYIILLVALSICATLFGLFRDIYLATEYGANGPPIFIKETWKSISIIFVVLSNLGAALWINHVAKERDVNRLIWSVFGLLFGLVAVGIFYAASIYEEIKT